MVRRRWLTVGRVSSTLIGVAIAAVPVAVLGLWDRRAGRAGPDPALP